jgi:hypothetical protein
MASVAAATTTATSAAPSRSIGGSVVGNVTTTLVTTTASVPLEQVKFRNYIPYDAELKPHIMRKADSADEASQIKNDLIRKFEMLSSDEAVRGNTY